MEINSTIIVQCLHFIIAYFMIKKLFLQPAYAYIQHEDTKRDGLVQDIEKRRGVVAHKEQAMRAAWQDYRRFFSKYIPHVTAPELNFFSYEKPSMAPLTLSKTFMTNETNRIEQDIVRAIRRHHDK